VHKEGYFRNFAIFMNSSGGFNINNGKQCLKLMINFQLKRYKTTKIFKIKF
jgi:hypothetical protein